MIIAKSLINNGWNQKNIKAFHAPTAFPQPVLPTWDGFGCDQVASASPWICLAWKRPLKPRNFFQKDAKILARHKMKKNSPHGPKSSWMLCSENHPNTGLKSP